MFMLLINTTYKTQVGYMQRHLTCVYRAKNSSSVTFYSLGKCPPPRCCCRRTRSRCMRLPVRVAKRTRSYLQPRRSPRFRAWAGLIWRTSVSFSWRALFSSPASARSRRPQTCSCCLSYRHSKSRTTSHRCSTPALLRASRPRRR